jgi:hypothetical protein
MLATAMKGAVAGKGVLGALAEKSPLGALAGKSPLGALAEKSPLGALAEKSPLGALAGKSQLGALADPKGALGGLLKKSPLGALAGKSPLGSLLSASIGQAVAPTKNQGPPLAPHPNKNITEGHLREKCPCIYGECAERLDELYDTMHRDPALRISHSDHQYIEQQLNKMFPEKCACIRGYTRGLTLIKKRKISNKRLRAQFDGILFKCGGQQGNTAEFAVKGAPEKAGGYRSVTARKRKTSRRTRRRSYKIKYRE